ncbi:hypothetical protein [Venatoribacter cucullus]|uniref:hypothetical protein n=1 Tax=Venatoribacter cucullus TaxID=2661630 RepID=UPI001E3A22FE|nr:hypothetical protein [Venatoribacter cucullus]
MATVFFHRRAGPNGPEKTAANLIFSSGLRPEEFSSFGFWLLAFGFWLLAFGFWLLAFGFWLLAFGFWFLVFGFARIARSIKPSRRSRYYFTAHSFQPEVWQSQ